MHVSQASRESGDRGAYYRQLRASSIDEDQVQMYTKLPVTSSHLDLIRHIRLLASFSHQVSIAISTPLKQTSQSPSPFQNDPRHSRLSVLPYYA